jgi:mRNA interferase RelE/StbE
LAWKVELEAGAKKDLEKLDKQVAKRVVTFLAKRVASNQDPRSIGQALKDSHLGAFWKYRVGDYRIICDIQDKKLVVLVLRVGHRREIYSR